MNRQNSFIFTFCWVYDSKCVDKNVVSSWLGNWLTLGSGTIDRNRLRNHSVKIEMKIHIWFRSIRTSSMPFTEAGRGHKWMFKLKIDWITSVSLGITQLDKNGNALHIHSRQINEPKCFGIQMNDFIPLCSAAVLNWNGRLFTWICRLCRDSWANDSSYALAHLIEIIWMCITYARALCWRRLFRIQYHWTLHPEQKVPVMLMRHCHQ